MVSAITPVEMVAVATHSLFGCHTWMISDGFGVSCIKMNQCNPIIAPRMPDLGSAKNCTEAACSLNLADIYFKI